MKTCVKCGGGDFVPNGRTYTRCNTCLITQRKDRYSKRKAEILAKNKIWHDLNPQSLKEAKLKYGRSYKGLAAISRYKANKKNRTPVWAKYAYIKLWYQLAKIEEVRTGRKIHVDHIIPLQGKLVCGLHCEDNLQLLFAEENIRKNNTFEIK